MTYEGPTNDPIAMPAFPFSVFNASCAFDAVPRFSCAGDVPLALRTGAHPMVAAAACTSTWVGVTLTNAAEVALFTSPNPLRTAPFTMRYTTDGTAPGPSSTAYKGPFTLSASCTVRAQSFDDATGAAVGVESKSMVTRA